MKNYKKYLSKLSSEELKDEYMVGSDTISTLKKAREDYYGCISIVNKLLNVYRRRLISIEVEYNKRLKG